MIEFGAKLSLKDNMSATLQKNLKMQKKFSDQVNRTSNNLKKLGKTKASPTISAKDKATAILKKVKNGLKAVGNTTAKAVVAIKDSATAGLSKIKSILGTLAKGVKIAVGITGAGVTALLGGSLSAGANLQQSVGGVETLFKGDAGAVTANADMAYKTAGLSANAYMEQVTSFSASLLQSLGGDTAKSAKIADMAIIDMADNANKFGTDMESIQNAYQGFAKQNYTMLDNLKLGYGGTKEEMQRLLKDATKLTGVQYDISNLSDVYSAIHAIQENMGVTGTTAKEASSTFSGAFASLKASISNLFGNMALGGDITASMEQVVESASTFLFNNAIPMVANVFKALPKAIKTGIKNASPKIKEAGGEIVKSLKEGLMDLLPSSVGTVFKSAFSGISNIVSVVSPLVQQIGDMFSRVAPVIAGTLEDAFSGDRIETFVGIISTAMPTIENLIIGASNVISYLIPVVRSVGDVFVSVFPSILEVINKVISTVVPIIQRLAGVIQRLMPIIQTVIQAVVAVFSTAWSIVSPILDIAMTVIEALLTVVKAVFPVIQSIIEKVWDALEPIFGGISKGLSLIGDAVSGVANFVGKGINTVKSWFGFAYGKDRVPYDNYPAVLHAGEKVLTRNQADQYDRQMSTRGVQLGETPASVTHSTTSSSVGTSINIEKLADTVIIEKEADVDKVVEGMITKFRKLVPNMA